MSRIDDLIAEHCPGGVERLALGSVVEILDNLRKPVTKDKREAGNIPYYGANGIQGYVRDAIFEGTFLLVGEDGSVINADRSPILNWATGRIWVNNHAHVLAEKPRIALLRYVYFALQCVDVSGVVRGVPPKLNQANLRAIELPIPPLEIQREIVRVLDNFTQLEAELEAELEARRKQYEFYRDSLLTFGPPPATRWATLGELATIVRGASPRPIQRYVTAASDGVPWIKIGDVPRGDKYITDTAERITQAGSEMSRFVFPGDFVLSNSMSFGRPYISAITGCIHDGWLALSEFQSHFLSDFLYHLLRSKVVQSEFKRRVGGGSVQNLNADVVRSVPVPIPPLDEQQRIVEILDKFDALVNDINVGLPAELAARRKQYEYYRDRLLTFDEMVA